MPKISIGLESAKAKDAEIAAKLSKIQQAAKGHKQQTKLNQQRSEYVQQAKKLASEARRIESDLEETVLSLDRSQYLGSSYLSEFVEEQRAGDESIADTWFQVAGVRQLLRQIKHRDGERLREMPEEAASLKGVLGSVSAAVSALGGRTAALVAELDEEYMAARRALRHELANEGLDMSSAATVGERRAGGHVEDLSDAEDELLERSEDAALAYSDQLQHLNDQVSEELAQLDQEVVQLRRKLGDWDDEAHFRFVCIKQQLQGRCRELLTDRLCLEFPHLTREQLQAHEASADALKYASQRQTAALRKWRRDRAALLAQTTQSLDDRKRAEELVAVRRQEALDQRAKQKRLQVDLQIDRRRVSVDNEARRRTEEAEERRRRASEAATEDAHSKHVQSVKELSREHAERRKESRRLAEGEQVERLRREAEERAVRSESNSKRVELREQMDEIKRREVMEQRRMVEKEAQEKAERLERAMEKLRVEAPRDFNRLLKEPQSRQAMAYRDPQGCVTCERGPHAGFDEKRLMGDARYKLSAALQAAGLFDSKAGHEALARVQAPRLAQPTSLSGPPAIGGYPG